MNRKEKSLIKLVILFSRQIQTIRISFVFRLSFASNGKYPCIFYLNSMKDKRVLLTSLCKFQFIFLAFEIQKRGETFLALLFKFKDTLQENKLTVNRFPK